MTFAAPVWLWLWLAVLIFGIKGRRALRDRRSAWAALGKLGDPPSRCEWPWLAALTVLIVAASGPRWGMAIESEARRGRDLVIAIDSSWSMAAEGRLAVAQRSAIGLIRALPPEDRCGIVTFAGRASIRCPMTAQVDAAIEAVSALRAGELTPGGSDLGSAVEASLELLAPVPGDVDLSKSSEPMGVIVLFSDGEDHVEGWRRGVERLEPSGAILHAIAIGDPERASPIPVSPPAGRAGWLKRGGDEVLSVRRDAPLQALAEASGGAWIPAGLAPFDAGSLYLERIRPVEPKRLPREQRSASMIPAERFAPFAVVALALMAAPLGLAWAAGEKRRRAGAVGFGLAAIVALGAAQDGVSLYAEGRYEDAARAFEDDRRSAPDHPIPSLNLAATFYRMGRFDEAMALYQEARVKSAEDIVLRAKADLGLGNTAMALGDLGAAIEHYGRCLDPDVSAIAIGAEWESLRIDAAINRRRAIELQRGEGEDKPEARTQPRRGPTMKPTAKPDDASASVARSDAPDARKQGGAGGGEASETRERLTPAARLDRALESIRQARQDRIPSPVAPMGASSPSLNKDW